MLIGDSALGLIADQARSSTFWDADLLKQLLATFVGVGLGIPAGFWGQSWVTKRHRSAAREQLVLVLRRTLEHNDRLLHQLERDWLVQAVNGVPSFHMDNALLEATVQLKYDILGDTGTANCVEHVRYELVHINEILSLWRRSHTGGTPYSASVYRKALAELVGPLRTFIRSSLERLPGPPANGDACSSDSGCCG